jgi:hypothetical protein
LSQSISVGLSKLESLRIDPTVNTTQIEQAEKKLNSLLAAARRAQGGLQTALDVQEDFKEGNPTGTYGPPRPFTSFDRSGRPLQERFEEINAINNARKLEAQTAEEVAAADVAAAAAAEKRAEAARRFKASRGLTVLTDSEAQISRTRQNLRDLQQEANKLSQAFDAVSNQQFFDTNALRRQQGELSGIREIIGRVSSDVRGPLAAAFQRYAVVVSNALQQGEDGFEENTQEIQRQRTELIKLIATTRQVGNVGQITGQVKRAGDIGRGGFDKFSLAINQAAFAIDDFFSATGGLEFKLRAVQNNITQLGFVAGGTKGLIAALAAAIGGQLVIAVLKSTGVLDKEKDTIEALNKAYSEQESRIQRLAQLYQNLGSSIRDAGLDEAGRTAAARARELAEVKRAEEEVRVARAAAADRGVVDLLREREALQRQAKEAPTAAERVLIEIKLQENEQEISRETRRAGERESSQQTVRQAIARSAMGAIDIESERRIAAAFRDGAAAFDFEAEAERVRTEKAATARGLLFTFDNPDFASADAQREALQNEINDAKARLEVVRRSSDVNAERQYEEQINALTAEYAALEARIRDAAPGAALVRFVEASFAVADTLDRARENLDQVGGGSGLIGSAASAVSRSLETRRAQADQARAEGDTERLDALTKQISALEEYALELESAAAATRIFSDTLDQLANSLASTASQEAQGRADEARRQRNEVAAIIAADGGRPGEAEIFVSPQQRLAGARLNDANEEARRASQREQEVRAQVDSLRAQFEERVLGGGVEGIDANLLTERSNLQEQLEDGLIGQARQQALSRLSEIDAALARSFEDSEEGRQASLLGDQADVEAQVARRRFESEDRGFALMETDGQVAARNLRQSLDDIDAAFNRARARNEELGAEIIPAGQEDQEKARQRVIEEQLRQAAPAVFALQDQVANAVLQGPSRAALNAADVNTSQGTAELNRLLRGDDPARDQNLVELQRQTQLLEEISKGVTEPQVAD